ncbi:MAG: MFS transporter [Cocleimonas sp.]
MATTVAKDSSRNWRDVGFDYIHPRIISMLFLGFSAGVPILLIFSSLGLWLREAGIERSTVTMFSWAALGYSFKFVWAPLVDSLPVPFLTKLFGRRRAWILVSQISIVIAILWMASIDPADGGEFTLVFMAMATVLLGFSSATQDIVIDAYRIEAADKDSQAIISSVYIAGYRIGMLVAGAGALFLASYWGSEMKQYNYMAWLWSYQSMALVMGIGIITTLIVPEPGKFQSMSDQLSIGYVLTLAVLLFSANELAVSLSTSVNHYYYWYVWFTRVLFLAAVIFLIFKKININKSRAQSSNFIESKFDNVAFVILGLSFLAWFSPLFIHIYPQKEFYVWLAMIFLSVIYIAFYIRKRVNALVKEKITDQYNYSTREYLGFLFLFLASVTGFILSYVITSDLLEKLTTLELYKNSAIFSTALDAILTIPNKLEQLKTYLTEQFSNKVLSGLLIGVIRLVLAITVAVIIAKLLSKTKVVNSEMVTSTYVSPIKDFFSRYGTSLALLLLALVGLYRISDIVLGVIAVVFYQDLGFTKVQIASIVKSFGLFMTIGGGFLGGILVLRFGVMKILFLGALLTVITNLLFVWLANMGVAEPKMLYLVISADNLTAGIASAVFIAFLSSLTNIKFTAVQYAIFTSLMSLLPKVIGGFSGTIVDSFCQAETVAAEHCMLGYENFFLIASAMGIPVLLLVWWSSKRLKLAEFTLAK